MPMVFYFVQRGETLYHIAKRYQTTVHAIVAANRLEDPNAVCPGQALMIPKPGEVPSPPPGGIVHLVRPGETIFHLARRFGTPVQEIMRANQIAHPEFILPGQQLVIPEPSELGDEWPMAGRTPGRAAASPALLAGPPAAGWSYVPRRRGVAVPSPPVVRYDRVYVGLGDGVYYCIDRTSGRARWRMPAPFVPEAEPVPLAAPAVFDGLVYLGTPSGLVLALDAFRGSLVWKVECAGAAAGAPAVVGDVVYVGCGDGCVYALEAKTGALAWRRAVPAPLAGPVAAGADAVYVLDGVGTLWSLEGQTGQVRWQCPVRAGAAAWPVLAELLVFAGGSAVDPVTGQVQWQVDEAGPPACSGEAVFYPGGAVNLFTGEYAWRWPPGGAPAGAAPAAGVPGEGTAAQGTPGEGAPVEGEAAGTAPDPPAVGPAGPGRPVGGLVAAGALLLAACRDGRLRAWQAADGAPAWEVDLGVAPCHAPAVVPGQVLVTLVDGSLRTVRARTEHGPAGR